MSGQKPIDGARATQLRETGLTFKEIGIKMAGEVDRPVVYQHNTIYRAIRKNNAKEQS